jgi:hypothetical protein
MYVGLDKAAAVRMYDYVREAWDEHLAELRGHHDRLPELERPWLASRIELMETTDMAVVVSQGQNEIAALDRLGLDIRPHRERMNREDLAEQWHIRHGVFSRLLSFTARRPAAGSGVIAVARTTAARWPRSGSCRRSGRRQG